MIVNALQMNRTEKNIFELKIHHIVQQTRGDCFSDGDNNVKMRALKTTEKLCVELICWDRQQFCAYYNNVISNGSVVVYSTRKPKKENPHTERVFHNQHENLLYFECNSVRE